MAQEQIKRQQKWEWEAKVVAGVRSANADEAWSFLCDFLAFHKWHPRVAKCWRVSGEPCKPGCIRYCEGTPREDGFPADWANETLLEYNRNGRFFKYEMNENNMGFGKFFAMFKVLPGNNGADDAGEEDHKGGIGVVRSGCMLEWSFESEPIKGTSKEALIARLQDGVNGMSKRVEEAMALQVNKKSSVKY